MNKKRRQHLILELVAAQPVASQEELRQLLEDRGFAVTQSTLSRDLRVPLASVSGVSLTNAVVLTCPLSEDESPPRCSAIQLGP